MTKTDETYIQNTIYTRKADAHKGDFGKVLIFAGSPGMAGAAILCGRAALKSGAGLVQFLLPSSDSPLLNILQCCVPEATCRFGLTDLKLSDYTAVACGSGLGKSQTALSMLRTLFAQCSCVLTADADALNLIAENEDLKDLFTACPARRIITPHTGEARRLLHTHAALTSEEERIQAVQDLAHTYHCIAVLKGAGTLIASDTDPEICINTTGNPGMATAGSGDSLTGLITSLAAQGYSPMDAARIGVFIHGKAGDLSAERLGEMGMTASDILSSIPYALHLYYQNS